MALDLQQSIHRHMIFDAYYAHVSSVYLSIVAGFSNGFWRKSLLDQNTNGLAVAKKNKKNSLLNDLRSF